MNNSYAYHTPVKINLALHILNKRKDAYHELESLVVFANKGDQLLIKKAEKDSFNVSGPYKEQLCNEEENLVIKARDLLRAKNPKSAFPVALTLEKNIPVSSGIGGGSGDGATALYALNQVWKLSLSLDTLMKFAQNLGADVCACLHYLFYEAPLFMSGIGEILQPLKIDFPLPLVLANNQKGISTKQVFCNLQNTFNPPLKHIEHFKTFKQIIEYLKETRNDLFVTALKLEPDLKDVYSCFEQTCPAFTRMSGSGGTCFALYESYNEAKKAENILKKAYPNWFIMALEA